MTIEIKSHGAGKYDEALREIREKVFSNNAVLLTLDGVFGAGCSIQVEETNFDKLPTMLRTLADAIELDIKVPPNDDN